MWAPNGKWKVNNVRKRVKYHKTSHEEKEMDDGGTEIRPKNHKKFKGKACIEREVLMSCYDDEGKERRRGSGGIWGSRKSWKITEHNNYFSCAGAFVGQLYSIGWTFQWLHKKFPGALKISNKKHHEKYWKSMMLCLDFTTVFDILWFFNQSSIFVVKFRIFIKFRSNKHFSVFKFTLLFKFSFW